MEQEERGNRKVKKGIVVSNKMQKTVVVKVERRFAILNMAKWSHVAKNIMRITMRLNLCKLASQVKIVETRPLSKLKRWRVVA